MTRTLCALALLAAACGDPLVGQQFLGTPTLTLSGQVTVRPGVPEPSRPRLSLFWLGFDTTDLSRSALEQRVEVANRFPAAFTMAVFDPPPIEAMPYHEPDDPDARVGVAFLVVYSDLNDNGFMNSDTFRAEGPDQLIGASPHHVIVYASKGLPEGTRTAELLGLPLSPGYTLLVSSSVEARGDATCGYGANLQCGSAKAALTPTTADDAPLELEITGNPQSVLLPKPADFIEVLAVQMPSTAPQ